MNQLPEDCRFAILHMTNLLLGLLFFPVLNSLSCYKTNGDKVGIIHNAQNCVKSANENGGYVFSDVDSDRCPQVLSSNQN